MCIRDSYKTDSFEALKIGPNKGDKVPIELAALLQANSRVKGLDLDLENVAYDVDVLDVYKRQVEQYDVDYIKGMVGKIAEENGKLKVQGSDLINGEQILIDADLVVLATAIEPDDSARSLASMLTASMDCLLYTSGLRVIQQTYKAWKALFFRERSMATATGERRSDFLAENRSFCLLVWKQHCGDS